MLHVFEVYVEVGHDPDAVLSEETKRETMAQVMTLPEAKAMGFSGVPEPAAGRELRLIAVAPRDSQWVHRQLEAHPGVTTYRMHEVG